MEKVFTADFQGIFFPATTKEKAMIVVSGSDGGIKWARRIASVFSANDVPSLAVAYWGTPNTSKALTLIPIEKIKAAVAWLQEKGYAKVGVYGISKGAELALVAAGLIPEISLVVAVSPSCCVFEGIAKPEYSGASSWTWNGLPLSYASLASEQVNIFAMLWKTREFGFTKQYLEVLQKEKNEENTIKAENTRGAVLLISAKHDAQWPSAIMGDMIVERLKGKDFAYPFHHEILSPASHILCPVRTIMRWVYRVERKHPRECDGARRRALRISLEWMAKF